MGRAEATPELTSLERRGDGIAAGVYRPDADWYAYPHDRGAAAWFARETMWSNLVSQCEAATTLEQIDRLARHVRRDLEFLIQVRVRDEVLARWTRTLLGAVRTAELRIDESASTPTERMLWGLV